MTNMTNTLPPCLTEDSTNCFWDAAVQGNGSGESFIDINGTAHYIERAAMDYEQLPWWIALPLAILLLGIYLCQVRFNKNYKEYRSFGHTRLSALMLAFWDLPGLRKI